MTNPKKKNLKRPLPLRNPGEDAGPLERPSKALFDSVLKAEELEKVALSTFETTLPSQTSQTTHTRQTSQSIAPVKDFQKVPNSITKTAIPEGLFKPGKSKHLYDVLYGLTRGAIVAKRAVRISKTNLRKLAAIGSRVTFDSCVSHLEAVGLIRLTVRIGEHEGNEFEVLTPDEITLSSMSSLTRQSSHTSPTQNLDRLVSLETSQTSQSSESVNTGVSDAPKTINKTINTDDEAFAEILRNFFDRIGKATGKRPTEKDAPRWIECFNVLAAEFEKAASKTTVSDAAAFFTEHLTRKFAVEKPERVEKKVKPDTVGKGSDEIGTLQSLTEDERSGLLTKLKTAQIEDSPVWREFQTYGDVEYTDDDYEWLKKKLE